MPTIPLVDLQAQYRSLKPAVDAAIRRVLASGQFILGPEVEALEREVAAFCGTCYAVAVASGTDALILALRAAGISSGDEVITSGFTFFATAEAILAVGATPVFADIDAATYTLDPQDVRRRLTRRTRALLPVHLYGHPCDMRALGALARARGLVLVEDCAQALGAAQGGRPVGSFGAAGCLSFYPSKNLGAYGDAGMVVTSDARLAEQVRLLRAHGSHARYRHLAVGTNSRLDELQAAILRVKLHHLRGWNAARRRHAAAYTSLLQRTGLPRHALPQERPGTRHAYALYTIRTPRRDRVQRALAAAGIACQVAYPSTVPAQPALRRRRHERLPAAEAAARQVLSLPLYPEMARGTITRVVATVQRALSAR